MLNCQHCVERRTELEVNLSKTDIRILIGNSPLQEISLTFGAKLLYFSVTQFQHF